MGGTLEKTANRPLVIIIIFWLFGCFPFSHHFNREEREEKTREGDSSRSTCMLAKYTHVKI